MKRQSKLEQTMRKLTSRVESSWAELHPVTDKKLQAVHEVVRKQWAQQQKLCGAPQNRPSIQAKHFTDETEASESAGQQLAKTHKGIADLSNLSLHQKPQAEALLARKKPTRYTGPRLRGQSGATQAGQNQPATKQSSKPIPQARRKGR